MGDLLSNETIQERLREASGWVLSSDQKSITLECVMKNFQAAIDFIQAIAALAEEADHHPDLHLTNYRNVTITLSTHASGGLTDKDFSLASQMSHIDAEFKDDPYQK